MAREFARFNLSIWKDPDWRSLPAAAQHLYMLLWSHPQLSYCGVVDWRPGRLAALAGDLTAADVETLGRCLEARLFLVIDPDTEEALIRSWVRWDGLMRQPRMAVSFSNAYSAVSSRTIQAVLVHEATKLRGLEPDLSGWDKPVVREVLDAASLDPRARALPEDPFPLGLGLVSEAFGPNGSEGLGPVSVAPTTATATSTNSLSTSEIADATSEAPREDVERLCQHLADRIQSNGATRRPTVSKKWRDAARLLMDRDERTEAQIHTAIDWCQNHEFWKGVVLSMPKLREKYDQIRLAAQRVPGRAAAPATPPPVNQY